MRQPHSGCLSSSGPRRRGDTKNKQLRALWEKNGHRPFPILFDLEDQNTIRPVGPMAKDFKSLLGVTVRTTVPYTYESWDKVPEDHKTAIWPQLETFFDFSPYWTDARVRNRIHDGVTRLAANLYSICKSQFKSKYFTSQGGLDKAEEIRQQPPNNMSPQAWNQLVDYYCRADNVRISIANSCNRAHHNYPSHHGTKAYVETRYERFQASGQYPSLIEGFRDMHSKHGDIPLPAVAQQQYDRMTGLLKAQEGVPNPLTEEQIMEEVLGRRRGFNPGRGQIVRNSPRYHSSSSPTPGTSKTVGRVYTQAEVDEMMATQRRSNSQLNSKINRIVEGLASHHIEIEWESVDEDED